MVARERERWGVTANGDGVSFWSDDNVRVCNEVLVMSAQLCEYTKNY